MKKYDNPFSFEKANDSTGFLLWKTHNYWQREIKKSLKEFDLTHTQFVVLANAHWLNLQNGDVTQIEIAQHAKIDVMMTSNVLRNLEKKGLVERNEHKTDTRAKSITLTNSGITLLNQAIKNVEAFDKEFFSKLDNPVKFNQELLELLA